MDLLWVIVVTGIMFFGLIYSLLRPERSCLRDLRSNHSWKREKAIEGLTRYLDGRRSIQVRQALMDVIRKDESKEVRKAAAKALGLERISPWSNLWDLLPIQIRAQIIVDKEDWDTVKILGAVTVLPLLKVLVEYNDGPLSEFRQRFESPNDESQTSSLRSSPSEMEISYMNAYNALLEIGVEAVPPLLMALKDEDRYIRAKAAEVLGELGNSLATEALYVVASVDKDKHVRSKAEWALDKINNTYR